MVLPTDGRWHSCLRAARVAGVPLRAPFRGKSGDIERLVNGSHPVVFEAFLEAQPRWAATPFRAKSGDIERPVNGSHPVVFEAFLETQPRWAATPDRYTSITSTGVAPRFTSVTGWPVRWRQQRR